ncbi:diguanylate cyclase [Candidatus Riflebacteria bacterium]
MILTISKEGETVTKISLQEKIYHLGRDDSCEIKLDSGQVSRKHAKIFQQDGKWFLEDPKSKRGTFKNGKRIEKIELEDGLIISIDPFELTFSMAADTDEEKKDEQLKIDPDLELLSFILNRDMQNFLPEQVKYEDLEKSFLKLEKKNHQFQSLLQIARMINSPLKVDDVLNSIMDFTLQATGAERGFIMLFDKESGKLFNRCGRKMGELGKGEQAQETISFTIAKEVFSSHEPIVIEDAASGTEIISQSIISFKIRSVISVPFLSREGCIGVLYLDHREKPACFGEEDLTYLVSFSNLAAVAIQSARFYEDSITDALTRAYNRKFLMSSLAKEFERCQRYKSPMSLLMFDIDHFKKFNDTYGHQTGDDVLKALAKKVQSLVRNLDIFARYGGEEFVTILPQTEKDVAFQVAERIRSEIEAMEIPHGDTPLKVTISIGVAGYTKEYTDGDALVKAADEELYKAKESGRNRVCLKS